MIWTDLVLLCLKLFQAFSQDSDNKLILLLSSDIVAFKEEFYELIDDVDAPPKQEQHTETEAIHTEKSEEKQKQTEHNWAWVDQLVLLESTRNTATETETRTSPNKRFLMSRTMAVHVRYNSWYISSPSPAKQNNVKWQFSVVWRTWNTTANLLNSYFKFITVFRQTSDSFIVIIKVNDIARFVSKT